MSVQDSTFTTAHVLDNEIVKANDFEFAFEKIAENVAKSTQMILESNQDFVINGKVLPDVGMNVKVEPIYGVCKSTGIPFGRTEEAAMEYGFEESANGRIDIIEVQGQWETYDNQQRAFNDPDTNIQTYQYVDTKKLMRPVYRIKKGVEGASVAPEVDAGWVKLAEVVIRANNSTISASDIKNITADIAGEENSDWTTEKTITYNIGYISDVNERFRVQHNEDGTHKDNVINTDSLDIGIGAKQVNGNVLPLGANITTPVSDITATTTLAATITSVIALIKTLYDAYYTYGIYNFKGSLSVSEIADGNNTLSEPITLYAAGNGTAKIKVGANDVISIDANGKLSTNGYTATSDNHIVTKKVTDLISSSLSSLADRVSALEQTLDNTEYTNGVLSVDRFAFDSTAIMAATTGNITLSGLQTIDGKSLSNNDYVLVKNQTNAIENGVYQVVSGGSWSRPTAFNTPNKLKAKIFSVNNGTVNKGKMFYMPKVNFTNGSAFGTDTIPFVEHIASIDKLPSKIAYRDTNGHVKTASATANEDAVNKSDLDSAVSTLNTAIGNKVDKTTTVNGHALSGNVTVSKSDVGLGSVENYGRDTTVTSGSAKYISSGGVYTALQNSEKERDTLINKVLSTGTTTPAGKYNVDTVTIQVATTGNVTLSGTQTIDGISNLSSGNYILVKSQTNKKQNGIYQYNTSSTWTRVTDYNTPNKMKGKIFSIVKGTANGGRMFYMPQQTFVAGDTSSTGAFTSDEIEFMEYFGSVTAMGNRLAMRDSNGHVKTANPTDETDAANKLYVDPIIITTNTTTIRANDSKYPSLVNGMPFKIMFTANISGSNTTSALSFSYKGTSYPVKITKGGTLQSIYAHNISSGVYRYIQAYTTIEVIYNSSNSCFIVVGNPVVLSSDDYTIYADGKVGDEEVGTIRAKATNEIPYGWLECNGQSVLRTTYAKLFNKFNTQKYDGTNTLLSRYGYADSTHFNLPDYREVALVGIGTNGTDSISSGKHDDCTLGQYLGDRLGSHNHDFVFGSSTVAYFEVGSAYGSYSLFPKSGDGYSGAITIANKGEATTRGKRKGVIYLIKVL